MTYFNLRKQETEAERDEATEDVVEASEGDARDVDEESAATEPLGFLKAFRQGVSGYFSWTAARIGAWTYLVHFVAAWAVFHYSSPWVPLGVMGWWGVGILRFMPRESLEQAAARIEARSARRDARKEASAEPSPEAPQEAPRDPLVAVMWRLIGEASGVHLKTLTEVLAKAAAESGGPAPSKAEVEASLEARGIPLRDSVRDARRKINRGVHRADLETWETALSPAEAAPPATGP